MKINLLQRFIDWVNGIEPVKDDPKPIAFQEEHPHPDAYGKNKEKFVKKIDPYWYKRFDFSYKSAIIICAVIFSVMLLGVVSQQPEYGVEDRPTLNEVFERYVGEGTKETGAINTVAGVILDYRAFDTFGEASLLFISSFAVISILKESYNSKEDDDD